jgi:hypothetical protein
MGTKPTAQKSRKARVFIEGRASFILFSVFFYENKCVQQPQLSPALLRQNSPQLLCPFGTSSDYMVKIGIGNIQY